MRGLEEVRFRQSVPDSGIKAYPAYDENTALLFNAFREVHFAIAHEMRTFYQLVAEPDKQEQRNTDIGRRDAAPVDGIFQERFIVLPQRNNQAQYKGENRPQREEPERYGKSFTSYPCNT